MGHDIGERGLAPSDCVVLGRTNRLIHSAADGLRHAGHEAFVPQKKTDFDSPVLGVLVEALRLANSRHDRVVLRRICREWEQLTGVALEPHAVGAAAVLVGGDFLRAWVDVAGAAGRESGNGAGADPCRSRGPAELPRGRGLVPGGGMAVVGRRRSGRTDCGRRLRRGRLCTGTSSRSTGPGSTLNAYLQHFDLSSKTPAPGPNAVQCITVHRSKGTGIQACLRDRDGSGGVSVVSGVAEGAGE